MNTRNLRVSISRALATLSIAVFAAPQALACTAFRMPLTTDVLIGRNFDWDYGHGLIIINKRGVAKSVLPLHSTDKATWVSKYGSLTFNQAGRELPYGGLNEKGLMIEVLWLGWTAWPVTAAPSINEVQWIQYQLDQRSSVQDLIAHLDDVRIIADFAKVHFIACDATGECATIEGLGNKNEVHNGATMPIATLTNDPYASSVLYADRFLTAGNCAAVSKTSSSSLDRFARASCLAVEPQTSPTAISETQRAHAILNSVAQKNYTKWSLVYDLTAKKVSIVTTDSPNEKTVSISGFDFSCSKPAQILDLNMNVANAGSDVTSLFTDYTEAANRSIVEKSLLTGFVHLPQAVVEQVVAFPDTMKCVNP